MAARIGLCRHDREGNNILSVVLDSHTSYMHTVRSVMKCQVAACLYASVIVQAYNQLVALAHGLKSMTHWLVSRNEFWYQLPVGLLFSGASRPMGQVRPWPDL